MPVDTCICAWYINWWGQGLHAGAEEVETIMFRIYDVKSSYDRLVTRHDIVMVCLQVPRQSDSSLNPISVATRATPMNRAALGNSKYSRWNFFSWKQNHSHCSLLVALSSFPHKIYCPCSSSSVQCKIKCRRHIQNPTFPFLFSSSSFLDPYQQSRNEYWLVFVASPQQRQ